MSLSVKGRFVLIVSNSVVGCDLSSGKVGYTLKSPCYIKYMSS